MTTFPTAGYVDRATLASMLPSGSPPLSEQVLGLQDGHPIYRCSQCHGPDHPGDNHPKVHVDLDTPAELHLHGDCVPAHQFGIGDPLTLKHIELAKSGVHGDDLRAALAAHAATAETAAEMEAHRAAVVAANDASAVKVGA
jgi:hypothetical protein